MWTTKRVLLLLMGFGLFFSAYLAYAFYLGGIDGLPPLPALYLPGSIGDVGPLPEGPPTQLRADSKLDLAFGSREDIKKMPIKLEVNSKNLVLASETFNILEDGRVRLSPFNLALFGKNAGEVRFPEINTIQSDVCFLTFDKPVSNIAEMGTRKITAAEIVGNVYVKNNRRTATQDDDLSMTTQGPLFYQEDKHMIWTKAPVRILDTQPKPDPTQVTAEGMDLFLTVEEKPAAAAAPKPEPAKPAKDKKPRSVNGVDRICLLANVEMHLADTNSGLMGSDKAKPAAKPGPNAKAGPDGKAAAPAAKGTDVAQDKPKIIILTAGPFNYDVPTDHATFDIPAKRGPLVEKVTVNRLAGPPGQEKHDQLTCEHLEIQFQRKSDAEPTDGDGSLGSLTIQDAHATGKEVVLDSDGENLHAIGTDFFHKALTHESILKGGTSDMVALKDGHEIKARELHMANVGDKEGQQIRAFGKGYVALLDKSSGKRSQYAYWDESAFFAKDKGLDCMTLTRNASFEDKDQHQTLGADLMKVWLAPSKDEPEGAKNSSGSEAGKMRPDHLEGTGHVYSHSEELEIEEPTEHLMVWFHDVPPRPASSAADAPTKDAPGAAPSGPGVAAPGLIKVPGAAEPPRNAPRPGEPTTAPPLAAPRPLGNVEVSHDPLPAAHAGQGGATPPPAKKQPLHMSARSVEAFVARSGEKNELERIRCEGDVWVRQAPQDPTDPNDKGIDIRGKTLNLDQAKPEQGPDGAVLVVTGDLAVVQMNKITIAGEEVNIDQRTNRAWVPCRGWMKMLSGASLGGDAKPAEKTPKKPEKVSELLIFWNKDMNFNGRSAVFQGNVQAEQDSSRLVCMMMQVFLDKEVSLKQGQPAVPGSGPRAGAPAATAAAGPGANEPAKVKELVCDKSVRMDDLVLDKAGKLVRRTRLLAPVVAVNNEDGEMNAPGPGVVILHQFGSADEVGMGPMAGPGQPAGQPQAPPAAAGGPPKEPKTELKLTRINFLDHMHTNNVKHTATFLGSVEVLNLPTNNFDVVVDVDHPPKGCLYIRCEQLKVFSRQLPDGRSNQEMDATRHVVVQSQEFWGLADRVTYDEGKDLVILEGGEGGKATVYRERAAGTTSDKVTGGRISYWRRENRMKIEQGESFQIR